MIDTSAKKSNLGKKIFRSRKITCLRTNNKFMNFIDFENCSSPQTKGCIKAIIIYYIYI